MTMMLNQWNPFRDMEAVQRRLFEPFLRLQAQDDLWSPWVPAVDVEERTDSIVIHGELPGLKPEQVQVDYDNGRLTISGERTFEGESGDRTWHRIERGYGAFSRTFVLPNMIDADHAEAHIDNGVLELVMPKREDARRRTIQIKGESNRRISTGKSTPVEVETKDVTNAA